MKKNKIGFYLVFLVVILLFVSSFCYSAYKNEISRIITEPAELSTVEESFMTVGFIVRDENRRDENGTNTSILSGSSNDFYISDIPDGARVAFGDAVALKFKSDKDARLYKEKAEIKSRIEYYEKLAKQSNVNNADLGNLDKRISSYVAEYVDILDTGRIEKLDAAVSQLERNITARQISTGTKINFTQQIKSLKKKYNELNAKSITVEQMTTRYPGFYISHIDGYESRVDYDSVTSLSVSKIEKLVKSKPDKIDKNGFGKIIGEFEWYAVCTVPSEIVSYLSVGSLVPVNFDDEENLRLEMRVESISAEKNGSVALVLSSSDMNEKIAEMRIEHMTVIVKSHTGYKISTQSLRENEEEELGVYVVLGNMAVFRKVSVDYYTDTFAVVIPADPSDSEVVTQVKPHDNIIVKGRNLYSGKLLSQ